MTTRRKFVRDMTLLSGAAGLYTFPVADPHGVRTVRPSNTGIILRFRPYELRLKHVFTLSNSSRITTPVMLTEIEYDGVTGYGEASMPPYLSENWETATAFLKKVDLSQFGSPFLIQDILEYVDNIAPGNHAAKASVDIALHDLAGKLMNQPCYRIWGLNPAKTPNTSFTIGIDKPDVVRQKVKEAEPYKILKVKLGQDNDREMIEIVRQATDKPICVDVNQGWKDREKALEMCQWLKGKNVVFVEQPMPKERLDDAAWLTGRSPLPVMADEAFQTIADFPKIRGCYSGINVKLMKCGGLRSAYIIIGMARAVGMKVMIGCMTETSCAVSAASQLSPLADWADLDGNLLIANDLFEGMTIESGKITLKDRPGIGIRKL